MKTDPATDYLVQPLQDRHNRVGFSCGVEPLDRYFRERAGQDMRRNIATPLVLIHRVTEAVAGFYTIASTAVSLRDLPPDVAHKLPKYPIVPATLLGRLAVDVNHRGKGLGEFILMDALRRTSAASREVASFAVVVDAKDESAAAFYRKYGFRPISGTERRLFLPMKSIDQLFP